MVSSSKKKISRLSNSSRLKEDISEKYRSNTSLTPHTSDTSHVNVIVFFLLIGVIIIMVASVVFNLVFLGTDIVLSQGSSPKMSQLTNPDPAKGVVTLQIIEPPEEKNSVSGGSVNGDSVGNSVENGVGWGVDS